MIAKHVVMQLIQNQQQLRVENETLKKINDQLRWMYCRLLNRYVLERRQKNGDAFKEADC